MFYSLATARRLAGREDVASSAQVLWGPIAAQRSRRSVPKAGRSTTPDEIAKERARVVDLFGLMLKGAGILGLLLGGIGVSNTMQVLLARRKLEIATLKTLATSAATSCSSSAWRRGCSARSAGSPVPRRAPASLSGSRTLLGRMGPIMLGSSVDPRVLLGGVAVGIATAVIFGLHAIARASAVRPSTLLRDLPTPMRLGRGGRALRRARRAVLGARGGGPALGPLWRRRGGGRRRRARASRRGARRRVLRDRRGAAAVAGHRGDRPEKSPATTLHTLWLSWRCSAACSRSDLPARRSRTDAIDSRAGRSRPTATTSPSTRPRPTRAGRRGARTRRGEAVRAFRETRRLTHERRAVARSTPCAGSRAATGTGPEPCGSSREPGAAGRDSRSRPRGCGTRRGTQDGRCGRAFDLRRASAPACRSRASTISSDRLAARAALVGPDSRRGDGPAARRGGGSR